ncbi:High-affnity carbon uptake protein Hat/HatR [Minicystis rosea]|nr:High-affnity carbon uptake protein Hat/HatR [Minicystis rosea]
MLKIAGYVLADRIHLGQRAVVYRGRREQDGLPVVVKILHDEYPSAAAVARFEREFAIGRSLEGQGVVPFLAFEPVQRTFAIVMEDTGARALRGLLDTRRLSLDEALALGADVADQLAVIHRRRVVHKDVNPSNIVVHPATHAVDFIDFGLATPLPRESPGLHSPGVLEGTLRYLSPEQTGRMNRALDHRTDLYSLGVMLYEMLTGRVPFVASDPVELVHLHLAQRPVPPSALDPAIPPAVSDIVMKLLAKTAEDRYQTAAGLAADLRACLAAPGRAPEGFVCGGHDVSDRLQIPEKLYGREAEIESLLDTFDRVRRGRAELFLVSGEAGVGKSALVHEIHKPVLLRRGYFASGKFDLLRRDIPYAPLMQAFSDLVRQILTESEERLGRFRERLVAALGDAGHVITSVIPSVALITGEPAPAPQLSPAEAQGRFTFVFGRFVRALAAEAHPIVLFLDDLQWADVPSLKLLQALLEGGEIGHLLVIGAYREREVTAAHPLTRIIEQLERAGARATRLSLAPLGVADVEQLVENALRCDRARGAPLARLIVDRTGGNPFFVGQLLSALDDDGLLEFDPRAAAFRWDLDAIKSRGLTVDVVDLMARKIQKLPPATRAALRMAACIGNRFDVATLGIVCERAPSEVEADLHEAAVLGLVIPIDESARPGDAPVSTYRFLHDRVQQAAYSLIEEEQRAEIHLRIGRLLLAATPESEREARLFDIAHQLALGPVVGRSTEERYEGARLHLRAGRKAKTSAAYAPAKRYFEAGLALLPADAWEHDHDLAFSLHAEAMEAQYLDGDVESGESLSTTLLDRVQDPLEKVRIHEVRASAAMTRGDLARAREEGYAAMARLGLDLPESMDLPGFFAVLGATQEKLGGRRAEDLLDLPRMTEPRYLAATRVALMLVPPLFMASPLLCLAVELEAMKLCLDHGNAPEAPYLYATYGMIQTTFLGAMDEAAAHGKTALDLVERLKARRLKAKVYMLVGAFVLHWKQHVRETIPLLVEAVQAGLETGDLEFMGYSAGHLCTHHFHAGDPLDAVLREHDRHLPLLDRYNLAISSEPMRIERQACLCLVGRADDPRLLRGESFDTEVELPRILAAKNYSTASAYYMLQTMLAYLFHDTAAAVAAAETEDALVAAQVGLVASKNHNFYQSLALLAACATASTDDRTRHLAKVAQNQETAERWANHAPMNGRHRFELVEAERARVRGDHAAATILYEDAARHAQQNGYLHDEGLIHALAGEHHLGLGRDRLARDCLLDAASAYRRWGATALCADLEQRHPEVFARPSRRGPSARGSATLQGSDTIDDSTAQSVEDGGSALDLRTVLKAALAVSGELVLDRLLDNLMRFAMENAGAERGFLILERDGALVIEAERRAAGEAPLTLPCPVLGCAELSEGMVQYAARTGEGIVLDDAAERGLFTADPYVVRRAPRSVLCAPLMSQGRLVAILYLENNLTAGAFTSDRLEVLRLLSAQAVLSIKNAVLYARLEEYSHKLEEKVEARTRELSAKNEELGRTLKELRDMQTQLVTQEKLASLGALTAGIAHEIKNPLNFVVNFAELSTGLADDIAAGVASQRGRMDEGAVEDLDDALESLGHNVRKINEHGRRANHIIDGMLMHARDSAGRREPADLNALLAESISLAYHGVRGKGQEWNLAIDAHYDPSVGLVDMVPSDISRVFVNVINNACYAMIQKKRALGEAFSPQLSVRTRAHGDRVEVRIRDNGTGVPAKILSKVWNPFFTTKPTGEGTGLGLSISHDIVAGAHQGSITMESVEGEMTEVAIQLPRR